MKKIIMLLIMMIICDCVVIAKGLLNKKYFGLELGYTRPGDSIQRQYDNSIINYGVGINYPILKNLDGLINITSSLSQGYISSQKIKSSTNAAIGSLIYSFAPNAEINPFTTVSIGIASVSNENKDTQYKLSDNKLYYSLQFGSELNINPIVSLRPKMAYNKLQDNSSKITSHFDMIVFFNKKLFKILGLGYNMDNKDLFINISMGIII